MGSIQRVGSRAGEDAEGNCGVVVEIAVGNVVLSTKFDTGDQWLSILQ